MNDNLPIPLEILPTIDSTNAELMRRFRATGLTPLTLLISERQTNGRGRLGRVWSSDSGNLTCSLGVLVCRPDLSGLSLAVGVALAQSLDPAGSSIQLKWPNDLWLHGRKLGGVLIETAAAGENRYVVIGVGINIASSPVEGAAYLQELRPAMSAAQAAEQIAQPLAKAVALFEREGFGAFAGAFAQRDALRGKSVQLSDGAQGTAQGVGPGGQLLVAGEQGLLEISSLEVSVRAERQAF